MTMTQERRAPQTRRAGAGVVAPALIVLGAACVAVAVVGVVWTRLGQRADERSRWSIVLQGRFGEVLTAWLDRVSVGFVAVGLLVCAVVALAARRPRRALGAALLVAGANVSTQVLKALVPRPDYLPGGDENSLPSGHTTVFVSLGMAAILVVPRALRPLFVLLASAAGTFTGAAVVLERWHRPSDVVAAVGVCAAWAGLALLVSGGVGATRLRAGRRFAVHLVSGLAGAAGVGALLITGGLVAHGTPSNIIVGGVTLTVLGAACAVACALVALGADARD